MNTKLSNYLSTSCFWNKYQSGYRANHSTETAVIKVVGDLRHGINEKNVGVLVLLEISKAFDSLNHFTLVEILCKKYRIGGNLLRWIASYISQRTQRVRWICDLSLSKPIQSRIPQGAVLGPVMFNLYTNFFTNKLTSKYHVYADDIAICCFADTATEAVDTINRDIAQLKLEYRNLTMQLNARKTQAMMLGITLKSLPF